MFKNSVIIGFMVLVFIGCDKDKNPMKPDQTTMFKVTIENIASEPMYSSTGVFNTPVGGDAPAPILPGQMYEFSFSAAPGSKLSFATMFGQSNDFFYAPGEAGIALFDGSGNQVTGDVTSQVKLWDAGTEVNQEPGLGPDQAPRQAAPNTGAKDPDNTVREAADTYNNLPDVGDVIRVTLTAVSATEFKARIENVSTDMTLATSDGGAHPAPMSPGVWVVHTEAAPLFTVGEMDRGKGLERIAEDGNPEMLSSELASESGIYEVVAPGVWAVHSGSNPLFTAGMADMQEGLEALAEDGDPSGLAAVVAGKNHVDESGVFNTPEGASSAGPAKPGDTFSFEFEASSGYLSFATMQGQTNDLFYAPEGMGISLFDPKAA